MDILKGYITEDERQLDKKVKVLRFGRGGEYYDKYNESSKCLGPFAKFLEKCGIYTQYTMLGTSQKMVLLNDVIVL